MIAGGGISRDRLAAGLILCGTLALLALLSALESESQSLQRRGRLIGAICGAVGGGLIAALYYPTWSWLIGLPLSGALLGLTYREWLRFM